MPTAEPGAAVSPGASTCSLAKTPALTVIGGLVLPALLPSLASEAVKVLAPAVLNVMLKVFVPETSPAFTGKAALLSDEVIPMVSVTVFTRFQLASTARTVIVKAVPAVCAAVVPVLPATVPGAAVSPGANNCNFTKSPALTAIEGLVLAVSVPAASLAVMVFVPAVLKVKLDKVRVPATNV